MLISGKSKDGSDARPFYGMFTSPDGETWGNQPFTEEQRLDYIEHETYWDIMNFHKNQLSFEEIYELIIKKESKLSRRHREFVIDYIENESNPTI
jgi:hypothetical protein